MPDAARAPCPAYNFKIFHLVHRNQRRISRIRLQTPPPVARSNKSFWICSDNRTPPRVSNITLHHVCAIGGEAYFNICTAAQQE